MSLQALQQQNLVDGVELAPDFVVVVVETREVNALEKRLEFLKNFQFFLLCLIPQFGRQFLKNGVQSEQWGIKQGKLRDRLKVGRLDVFSLHFKNGHVFIRIGEIRQRYFEVGLSWFNIGALNEQLVEHLDVLVLDVV